jgi:hypothetical protein
MDLIRTKLYQTVVHRPPVVRGCSQMVLKDKALQKLYQTLSKVKVKVKVKLSLYTPWRRLGGEEV